MVESFYKVVLYGKPNVGKSHLFNVITNKNDAIVTDLPGLTRDSKYGLVFSKNKTKKFVLTDMAGIEVGESFFDAWVREKVDSELQNSDVILFVVDIHNIEREEEYLLKNLRKKNIPFLLCANKADREEEDCLNSEVYRMGVEEVVFVSCKKKRNIEILKKKILIKSINCHLIPRILRLE